MKAPFVVSALCLLAAATTRAGLPEGYEPREGDVVFQSFHRNALTIAIEGCQGSPLSHCGIVAPARGKKKGANAWVVLEAVGPVKETPLSAWIERGRGQRLAVYRFSDRNLAANTPAIIKAARRYLGRPYDFRYRWDDDQFYCSELVYKAVRDATRREIGKLDRLGDLDWKPHEKTIRELEGGPPPLDRKMITPIALTRAPELQLLFLSGYLIKNGEVVE